MTVWFIIIHTMMDTLENEVASVIKLKRKRKTEEWKSVKNKKLKAKGVEYTGKKGKKAARQTGVRCR